MSVFSNFLDRFTGGDVPVMRMKGCRRSSRYLLLHFPASAECTMRTIPYAHLRDAAFSVSKQAGSDAWTLYMNGKILIADIGAEEDAREVMRRIACAVAPSNWRWVRRAIVVWLLFVVFIPARSHRPPQVPYVGTDVPMIQAPMAMPGYPAPRAAAPVAPPAVLQQAPAQASPAAPAADGDPFGLQVMPSSK